MKHFAIPATLAVSRQQPQAAFGKHESVASSGTLEDLAVQALCTMGIEKAHKVQRDAMARTNGAGLSHELLSTNIDRSRIS